jgi:hypothetical protein
VVEANRSGPDFWVSGLDLAGREAAVEAAIRRGDKLPAGRLLGLPELPGRQAWVDMAGACAITRHPEGTITSWVARSGPKWCPLPTPSRVLYRLYWPEKQLREWRKTADQLGK